MLLRTGVCMQFWAYSTRSALQLCSQGHTSLDNRCGQDVSDYGAMWQQWELLLLLEATRAVKADCHAGRTSVA